MGAIAESVRSNKESSLRVGPLVNLAPLVRSLGCRPEVVFADCGYQLDEFLDPDHRISFVQASRLSMIYRL